MAKSSGRVGRPWRRVQAKVFEEETHCWLCGGWVDQSIQNPRHPMARSVDHVIPRSKGGDPEDRNNLRLAHFCHNSARGNRQPPRAIRSREW